jgi:LysM repeat protein
VLILAVAGGLFTAWIVANMRAVPGPIALASANPGVVTGSNAPSLLPGTSAGASEGPRRTPTPAPTVELTPAPFTHVVQKGESLNYIAGLFQVNVQDIIDLNNLKNPNNIQPGQELLIPGYGVQPTPKPTKSPKK